MVLGIFVNFHWFSHACFKTIACGVKIVNHRSTIAGYKKIPFGVQTLLIEYEEKQQRGCYSTGIGREACSACRIPSPATKASILMFQKLIEYEEKQQRGCYSLEDNMFFPFLVFSSKFQ
jgi:hypothetical protein